MKTRVDRLPFLLTPLALAAAALPAGAQIAGTVERASVSSSGVEANGASVPNSNAPHSISADGRFVAFACSGSNLVPGDTNGVPDVFVRDLVLGTTERVSVSTSGQQANGNSSGQSSAGTSLSADGRFVAFYSVASNLVSGDSGGKWDIFVNDRVTGITERVSVSTSGGSPNESSRGPSISGDGRYVLFDSYASNIVSQDKNNVLDVFLRDRWNGTTQRISVRPNGSSANGMSHVGACGNTLSADGHYAVFVSAATNLVTGDTNGQVDVFVRDLWANFTQRASVTATGGQANGFCGNACISGDGRYVGFLSSASSLAPAGATPGLYQVYVRDLVLGTTTCASVSSFGQASDRSALLQPALSGDGRFLVFTTNATNLVPGATSAGYNVFVRDLVLGTTECPTAWAGGWGLSVAGLALDSSGSRIAFGSPAATLVPGDTNGVHDIFVLR